MMTRFHGTNERLAVEDYARLVSFYQQLIRNSDQI
jgi:acetylornithine deacetylase/succinyl-diaminopimelate desuccinylase-like protein